MIKAEKCVTHDAGIKLQETVHLKTCSYMDDSIPRSIINIFSLRCNNLLGKRSLSGKCVISNLSRYIFVTYEVKSIVRRLIGIVVQCCNPRPCHQNRQSQGVEPSS